jgi:3-hydroxyisobutyrate dehydrogenase-like beta-hydroxyacid dehydrogenase
MERIGFIGLGTMGSHMARNVLKAGFKLTFLARRTEVTDAFVKLGATPARTPAEVAAASDIILSIVTADAEVTEVATGMQGIIKSAAKDKLYIDMSTVGPWTVRQVGQRLAEAGMPMLDAPVSGGPWGAESATLTVMCGGEKEHFERARPVFEALGKRLFHVGPLGSGQTIKIINQMMAGAIMAIVGEGFVLAKAAGADLEAFADVVAVSSGGSTMFEHRAKKFILADQYQPGFKTELMRKDVGLAVELAEKLNIPMPLAAAALQQYMSAIQLGHAADDFAAVLRVCEQAAGVKVVEKG